MRYQLQTGHVLHTRAYRESSLMLDVFTRDQGRSVLVAKGARRAKSPWRGLLQPFRPLLLSWSGGGEVQTLIGAEPDGLAWPLAGRGLLSGFYVNELVMRLLQRHDPHPALYPAYLAVLKGLAQAGREEPTLRVFEKRLLDALGYGLVLERESGSGRPIEFSGQYRYLPEQGPVPADLADGLGIAVSGATLLALAGERLDAPDCLRQAKRLMRQALGPYLGDKPLKSRSLFQEMFNTRTGGPQSN